MGRNMMVNGILNQTRDMAAVTKSGPMEVSMTDTGRAIKRMEEEG